MDECDRKAKRREHLPRNQNDTGLGFSSETENYLTLLLFLFTFFFPLVVTSSSDPQEHPTHTL